MTRVGWGNATQVERKWWLEGLWPLLDTPQGEPNSLGRYYKMCSWILAFHSLYSICPLKCVDHLYNKMIVVLVCEETQNPQFGTNFIRSKQNIAKVCEFLNSPEQFLILGSQGVLEKLESLPSLAVFWLFLIKAVPSHGYYSQAWSILRFLTLFAVSITATFALKTSCLTPFQLPEWGPFNNKSGMHKNNTVHKPGTSLHKATHLCVTHSFTAPTSHNGSAYCFSSGHTTSNSTRTLWCNEHKCSAKDLWNYSSHCEHCVRERGRMKKQYEINTTN